MSNGSPFFTVVIPVYNRADLIGRTIKSVISQTFADFEIIVVDDGSVDDLKEALSIFKDPRLNIVRQNKSGASSARNNGIDRARGAYVALLDSDDSYQPNHLETMRSLIENFGSGCIVYSPVLVDRGVGLTFVKPPRPIRPEESMSEYLMCDRGFIQTSGLCVPTLLARNVRYRNDATFGDDTDFAVRLQLSGGQFVMSSSPSVIWADDMDHERLSDVRKPLSNLIWLEELRPYIPSRAYHGYRGWHLAKSLASHNLRRAISLYIRAVVKGAYSPRLAMTILLQIVLPDKTYRNLSDIFISKFKGKVDGASS